jgi:HAD superfamily phosphatase (TIGR01668 family)
VVHTAAVFFDVDFTLIHPGPRFQGEGYQASCSRLGIEVDPSKFDEAVAGAAAVLETTGDAYDPKIYLTFTRRIVELMGGAGPALDQVAQEIFDDWNCHDHFTLYDDVLDTLARLQAQGLRLGLISNTARCLESFQAHFALSGLISVAISSSSHGFMKPHPSIFQAALDQMQVSAEESVMVGDSLLHDVIGARSAGMRGILLARGSRPDAGSDVERARTREIPVIQSLTELPNAL